MPRPPALQARPAEAPALPARTVADSSARWYFGGSVEKHVDGPFPGNPSCGYGEAWGAPICSNCANRGLGSNCLWDAEAAKFRGLE